MSKPVRLRPQARANIEAIAAYLLTDAPDVALRFIDAAEAACTLLAAHPASGSTRHAALFPELPVPLRFHPVHHFAQVLIYYMDLPDAVEIIRVWDARRGLDALMEHIE